MPKNITPKSKKVWLAQVKRQKHKQKNRYRTKTKAYKEKTPMEERGALGSNSTCDS